MKEPIEKINMGKNKRRIKYICCSISGFIVTVLLIHVISMLTLDRCMEYKEVSFHSAKISAEMNGYKIAFISDTHKMTAQELKEVVSELNKLAPDLLILGGDFPSAGEEPMRSMEVLSKTVTTDGIYGVEGNHDKHIKLFEAMEQYSIQPLSNNGVHIRESFYLAGVEDLWNRNPDIKKATEGALENDFVLLVAHNPDISMLQSTEKIDLILSGHTHGGQITLFGIWAPYFTLRKSITKYGQRFMSGWAESRDGVPVYVSKGTGYFSHIPRVFARPQVILITLLSD